MMRIEIPYLPQASLSLNWRGHWGTRSRDTQQLRKAAKILGLVALSKAEITRPMERAVISVTWINRQCRWPDPDNALARLKAAFDGLVDAGVIAGDSHLYVSYLPILFKLDKRGQPRVIIEVMPDGGS